MIVFQSIDKKVVSLINGLKNHNIKGDGVKVLHPVLTPFYIIKLLIGGQKIRVFVFRYLNDSNNLGLAIVRYFSDIFTIILSKVFKIRIWFLCHNVDRETAMFFPKIIKLRRSLVARHSELIITTNEFLIPKAQSVFPNNRIKSISLGYVDDGVTNLNIDIEVEQDISKWIQSRKNENSKFVFCVGSPAKKAVHFKLINEFISKINAYSELMWYAIVIGDKVVENEFIYNIPYRCALSKEFIKTNAHFYYRVIDDFSMSYSTYEAVHYRIPTITENYGILPVLIREYNIGCVVNSLEEEFKTLVDFNPKEARFNSFEFENNWKVAARKLKNFYFERVL